MEKCIFIGYPQEYKGWKFYNPGTKRVIILECANFDEHFFINQKHKIRSIPHLNCHPFVQIHTLSLPPLSLTSQSFSMTLQMSLHFHSSQIMGEMVLCLMICPCLLSDASTHTESASCPNFTFTFFCFASCCLPHFISFSSNLFCSSISQCSH